MPRGQFKDHTLQLICSIDLFSVTKVGRVRSQKAVFWEHKERLIYCTLYVCVLIARLYLTLCNPMDYSLPCFSVPGILQARIVEWVAILFSGIFQPRDQTQVSCFAGRFFTIWATREALIVLLSVWISILFFTQGELSVPYVPIVLSY